MLSPPRCWVWPAAISRAQRSPRVSGNRGVRGSRQRSQYTRVPRRRNERMARHRVGSTPAYNLNVARINAISFDNPVVLDAVLWNTGAPRRPRGGPLRAALAGAEQAAR